MSATISTSLTVPNQQALPEAAIKADQAEDDGAHAVLRTLQSLYAYKGGAVVCDMFQGTGNLTSSQTRYYRWRTTIYGGLSSGSPPVKLYIWRTRANSGSWEIDVSVNGGGATTHTMNGLTGDQLEYLGQFNIDDTSETNDITLVVTSYAGTLSTSQDYVKGFYVWHSFSGSILTTSTSGYSRNVIPIDEDAFDVNKPGAVAWWQHLKAMAEDIYTRRVPMLYTSSYAYSAGGALETVTKLRPHIPVGVSQLKFYIRVTFYGFATSATIELHYRGELEDHDSNANETVWLTMTVDLADGDTDPYIEVKAKNADFLYMGVSCETASLPL